MKITTVVATLVVAFGYLGFRVLEYVTAIEGTHRIMMGESR